MNMPRKRYDWKLKSRTLLLGERTLIAGFLDLSSSEDPDRAFVRAIAFADQGADMIELAADPPVAGSAAVSEAEELRRLVPALKRLKGKIEIPLAVLTSRHAIALKAIEHGAEILHDPTGLTLDLEIAKVANQADAGLVLSHARGTPEGWVKLPGFKNPTETVVQDLSATVSRATRTGVQRHRLMIDPGFGYGKRKEHNVELLARLDQLAILNLPILVAPYDKAFLPPQHDAAATALASLTTAILSGAHIVVSSEVPAARAAAQLADEVLRT